MGRIATTFDRLRQQGDAGLIPFIVAGDPDMETTAELIRFFLPVERLFEGHRVQTLQLNAAGETLELGVIEFEY